MRRRRIRRRRKSIPWKWIAGVSVAVALLAGVVFARKATQMLLERQLEKKLIRVDVRDLPHDGVCAEDAAVRPLYPHSVISRGACSGTEVEAALMKDASVAGHYSDIQPDRLRLTRLERSTVAYVSYRSAAGIFWTARPVVLAANEYVLTDGVHKVRARCGNRISLSPQAPVAPNEEIVRQAMERPLPPSPIPSVIAGRLPAPRLPDTPLPPIRHVRGKPDPQPPPNPGVWVPPPVPPTTVIPEPGTLALMGGVAVLSAIAAAIRRRLRTKAQPGLEPSDPA